MLKILVLEDDRMIQSTWRDLLPMYGQFHVVDCPAAARAVLATGFRPDVIFSDWDMPGGTGGEFCAWLRARGDTTPLVIISGLDRSAAAHRVGATACWLKPYRLTDVEQLLAGISPRPSTRPRSIAPTATDAA